MRKKTKERKEIEKSLLYYLQLYNEIKGRNEAWQILSLGWKTRLMNS